MARTHGDAIEVPGREQHLELDSTCANSISQTVATQTGAKYVLSFDFSPRPGVITNDLQVHWNEALVFDLSAGGFGLEETEWTHYSAVVTATGSSGTVQFSDPGFGDGVGTYIDKLPEPGRPAGLVAGLSLVAGLAQLRRRTARSRSRGRSR